MEETISLQDIVKTLKKRVWMIVTISVAAAILAAVVSYFMLTPIYEAKTQVLVTQAKGNQTSEITSQEIQSDLQLINTYNEIIKSPAILSIAIEDLDLAITPAELATKITVGNSNNSQVVNISVQDENYNIAVDMANQVVKVFQNEMPGLMNVDNVKILSAAEPLEDPTPIKPNKPMNVAIAFVIGVMVSIGLAFLLEFLDKTVKTEQDVEELTGLPVIGLISPITDLHFDPSKEAKRRRKGGQS